MFFLILLFSVHSIWANSQCTARYDQLEIPHIEVESEEQFYYCFGFQHGKDRAWEMDYFRRVGQGRNAEVLGYSHLKNDLTMRLLDLEGHAERLFRELSSAKKRSLEAYARGANSGFENGKRSQEFISLGYEPEPWKPQDSILVLLLQSFDQTRRTFSRDMEEEKRKSLYQQKTETLFSEEGVPWFDTILKSGEYVTREVDQSPSPKTSKIKMDSFEFPAVFGEETGSNNWVIEQKLTKNKVAILANDPHLDLKTPLFWYWIHLRSKDHEVIGGSVPGVPVIPSGTNGKVSWGLTNAYIKTGQLATISDYKGSDLVKIRPTVDVKLWIFKIPFFFKSFERLVSGHPVLPLEHAEGKKVFLRWSGFDLKGEDVEGMFDFALAKNVSEMDLGLKKVGVPAWNFVFADTHGEIGYRVVGQAYRQTNKSSLGIADFTKNEFLTPTYLTPEERPGVLKPQRGFIYTANHRHWPQDGKFYGGRGYSESFRGFRLNRILRKEQDVSTTMKAQCDDYLTDADFFLPLLKRYLRKTELDRLERNALDSSRSLPLFRRILDLLKESWSVNDYALYRLLQNLDETKISDLRNLWQKAKEDIGGRSWEEVHRLRFPHLSGHESFKFSPEIPGPGDAQTVNPGTSVWDPDKKLYLHTSGASMRMIIEMTERPRIRLSLPGRNRDYHRSVNGANPWTSWKSCEYQDVEF